MGNEAKSKNQNSKALPTNGTSPTAVQLAWPEDLLVFYQFDLIERCVCVCCCSCGSSDMILDKCTDACGYAAAVAAAICLGSFGVPAKSKVVTRLDADPLVIQTYKSTMGFLTCWLVVLLGEPIRFTSWGIVSGIFWVPGGVAGIYGIRNAGLAIAVGTWSSIIVLTSFFWGIGVFEEHVRSELGACSACLTLVVGLIGMARYSKPPNRIKGHDSTIDDEEILLSRVPSTSELKDDVSKRTLSRKVSKEKNSNNGTDDNEISHQSLPKPDPLEMEALLQDDDVETQEKKKAISIGQFTVTRRQMGIIAAMFNGLWGGTVSQFAMNWCNILISFMFSLEWRCLSKSCLILNHLCRT